MLSKVSSVTAAFVASLGAFLFGLDIGYIAPILECASFKRDVAHLSNWSDPKSTIPSITAGILVGIFSLGAIFTALPIVSSYFLDVWGRRASIIIGSVIFMIGCVFQATAFSMAMMLAGRLVTGCSIGLLSAVVPLYQSEVAPSSMRGMLTSLYQLMITFGILVAAYLDLVLVSSDNGWRTAIWLQLIPVAFLLLVMPFLPRSPRWLVAQGRVEEAKQVLMLIREPNEARSELEDITSEQSLCSSDAKVRMSSVVHGRMGKMLAIGVSLQLLQQLVGMNAFMYFGPRIFQGFGLDGNKFQTINNLINFVSTFPALYLADHYGRRSLLIPSACGMAIACFVMALLGHAKTADSPLSIGILMSLMVFFFVFNFAYGWGPMVWVYCAEMFPFRFRGFCVGMTTTANWVGNYLIAQFTPMLLGAIGFNTFYIFGLFSLIAAGLAVWLPETKGVGLEHIDALFDDKLGCEGPTSKAAMHGFVLPPQGTA